MSAPTLRPVARPTLPRRTPSGAGPWQVGATAALWALLGSLVAVLVPVLVVWASDGRSAAGALEAVRTAGQVWSLAHLVPLGLPRGTLSLVPLGLLALPVLMLMRAGRAAARAHPVPDARAALRVTVAVAVPYAAGAVAVAALSATTAVRPSVGGALLGAGAVALLGAGAGVLRTVPDLTSRLAGRVPGRRLVRPASAAVLVLLGAGALLVGVRLAVAHGAAGDLARATAPGAVGGVALLLLGLALVPNAVVWGACWWAGPGFAVGTGTSVGPFGHSLGPVPPLPLLAALPSDRPPLGLALLSLLVPLLAGVVAGLLLRRGPGRAAWSDALLCGVPAAVAMGGLAWVSGGAAGGGHLREMGPSVWVNAVAVGAEVGVGALVVVALGQWRSRRVSR